MVYIITKKFFGPGMLNVLIQPLLDSNKVLLTPYHIKLVLVKQFLMALDFEGEPFQEIRLMFLSIFSSQAKIKGGIFVGPQLNAMLKSEKLERCAFRDVVFRFVGNHKGANYKQLVTKHIKNFKKLGCRISLKVYFLYSYLDFFSENLGDQ